MPLDFQQGLCSTMSKSVLKKSTAMPELVDPEKLTRVAAIVFYGRSGSLFLQSLLDGHPNVLSIPGPYLIGFYNFWDAYGHLPPKRLIDAFLKTYAIFFNAKNPCRAPSSRTDWGALFGFTTMGKDGNQSLGVDYERFAYALNRLISGKKKYGSRYFFQMIHSAYAYALNKSSSPGCGQPIIVYQFHKPDEARAARLLADFPDSLFLHTIRYPVQSLGSLIKHLSNMRLLTLDMLLWSLQEAIFGGVPLFEEYRERSRAVKLEDLHTAPAETLANLCRWLGIPWHGNLLESTFDGLQWWNLGDGAPNVSGFNTLTISKKHEDVFSSQDRMRLETLLSHKCSAWGYPAADVPAYSTMKEAFSAPFLMEKLLPSWEMLTKKPREAIRKFFLNALEKVYFSNNRKEIQPVNPYGPPESSGWNIPFTENFEKKQLLLKQQESKFAARVEMVLPIFVKRMVFQNPAVVLDLMRMLRLRS